MITVSILINGQPIFTRSATQEGEYIGGLKKSKGYYRYKLDDGTVLIHKRDDGAVKLAKMMLDTIKEQL
jgi:hypothetical protein